jgi:hypothetical protein
LVVGYEVPPQIAREAIEAVDVPPWSLVYDHQAGGYSCTRALVLGAALRLEANLTRGNRDLRGLVGALRYLGEYWEKGDGPEHPELDTLSYTRGDDYGPEHFQVLENLLLPFLKLPCIERGIEAFVTFEPCAVLEHLQGWLVMQASNSSPSFMPGPDWKLADATDTVPFDQGILSAVEEIGKRFCGPKHPQIHLLWNNSD